MGKSSGDGSALLGRRKFTRSDILAASAEQGRCLMIFDSKVYDVTSWAPRHPGGELVIRHMVGRDATDQIRVNHSNEVIRKMAAFYVGDVVEDGGKTINRPLSLAFRKLNQQFEAEGFYNTDYWFYAKSYFRFLTFAVLSIFTLLTWGHTLWGCTISAVCMGAFWQQMAFVAHDTGHNGITHRRKFDSFVGIILGNVLGGISIGWWKGSHNVHHLVTNDPEHDPDVQLLPFLAVTERLFDSVYSTFHRRRLDFDRFCQILVPLQHFTYYPLMLLGRFNLYRESFVYLFRNKTFLRTFELVGLFVFWAWYLYLVSFLPDYRYQLYFILLSHMVTFILHVQITLSHFAMSAEPMKEDEEFIRYQLRTTLDVDCPEWLDWFHGGLQFQLAHHLFPRLPRHNLRKARERIIEFCNKYDLTYNCKTFVDGNVFVIRHLQTIANQVKFYAHVASKNIELDFDHHAR